MEKKIFFGNLIGSVALVISFIGVMGIVTQKFIIAGIIELTVSIALLLIAVYMHGLIKEEKYKKELDTSDYYCDESCGINEEAEKEREINLEEREREYQLYLDAKAQLLVEAFAILTDKRTNKERRAKKIRKYIQTDIFKVEDIWDFDK